MVAVGQVLNLCPLPLRPADGVHTVAVVVGGRELIVCDRDVARSAPAGVTTAEAPGRARQAYRACRCRCRRRRAA